MIKKIVLIAEVDGDITKDSLRLAIDDEGSIVLYPKNETANFKNCSVNEVSCGVTLSADEITVIDYITSLYKLPFEATARHIVDCYSSKTYSLQDGVDMICEAIACDKGELLNKKALSEHIKVFKNLCSEIGIPTNWEE